MNRQGRRLTGRGIPGGGGGARLTPISGIGGKGPACFLVEVADRRLVLDIGVGPDIGQEADVRGIGRVNALVLSHAHGDHAGGLHLLGQIGNPPVYATDIVASQITMPDGGAVRTLPLRGCIDVSGIKVTTGRNGHSPGGVWLHLDVGHGVLYAGDTCVESEIYAFDDPPPAATAIIDASDGFSDEPQSACRRSLRRALAGRQALLPVPATGRGPEIALFVLEAMQRPPALCGTLRRTLERLIGPWRDALRPGADERLSRVLAAARPLCDVPDGIALATNANANQGESARLLPLWHERDDVAVVLTGYVPRGTPVMAASEAGRATSLRWNVHPRLSDNAAMLRSVGARAVVPAFVAVGSRAAWENAFASLQVAFEPLDV
ncbi:MAG: MBL fold metallo-hydrolase [Rhodospirillales bacterium]|nr:MBL fold metallo-hydrolase [Rhodospirillales bacterium]